MKKAKKRLPTTVVAIAVLIVFAMIGSLYYTKYLRREHNKEITSTIKNILTSSTERTYQKTVLTYSDLMAYSKILVNQGDRDYYEHINLLVDICEDNNYICIGVADMKGYLLSTNGMAMNVAHSENFQTSIEGEPSVTSTIVEGIEGNVLIFSVPIMDKEIVNGVMFAICSTDYFDFELKIEQYYEKGTALITQRDGTVLCKVSQTNNIKVGDNIFDIFYNFDKEKEHQIDKMKSAMKSAKDGEMTVRTNMDNYLYYKPMQMNDWYVILIVPESTLMISNNKIVSSAYLITGLFIILYLITFLIVMRMQNNNREKIERIAYVDELTGGLSFEKFKKEVAEIMNYSNNKTLAMVSIDIDKFKFINDIFGYEEGNRVIQYLWNTINEMIGYEETFAHRKADQFVLLLDVTDKQRMIKWVENLSQIVSERETRNEKNYEIILSIGIYIIDNDNKNDYTIDNAIDRAELTKKTIKGKHNEFYAIYDDKLRQKILRDQEIENKMEKALKNREFKVYYQPKFNAKTCELVGAEALVRWYNEKTGMMFPNEFISLFERNGFIIELDKYMFESVCRDIRTWLDNGYKVVPISVNLSQLQLYNLHFVEEYKEILEKYQIPPQFVQLELTETTLFSKASGLNKIIDKLHNIGFLILMDDFGTGYSSLNMLKNVPVDILKLDKSFVDDIGDTKGDLVVSTIVSLGQSLDMKIVAEGVETKEQYEFLRDIFCDEIQGYYFSRPISEKEYRQQMKKGAHNSGFKENIII